MNARRDITTNKARSQEANHRSVAAASQAVGEAVLTAGGAFRDDRRRPCATRTAWPRTGPLAVESGSGAPGRDECSCGSAGRFGRPRAFTRRAVGAGRRRSRRNRHAPLRSELAAFEPRLGARGPTNATASTYRSRWPQPLRRQYPRGGRRHSHPRNIASRRTGPGAVGSGLGALLWRTAAEPWEAPCPAPPPRPGRAP